VRITRLRISNAGVSCCRLPRRACADQRHRDFDRIVIDTGQELDCAQDRVAQPRAQIGDFRNPHGASVEITCALIEHPFQNKGHCDPARGHRGCHAPSGGYCQFPQRLQAAEPAALRLIEELAAQMCGRQIDDRSGQLKSRLVNRASKVIPAWRKFSAAPSRRSTTVITFTIVH